LLEWDNEWGVLGNHQSSHHDEATTVFSLPIIEKAFVPQTPHGKAASQEKNEPIF